MAGEGEKRKGKALASKVPKKSKAERQAELAARAAEEIASGRARGFHIDEQPAEPEAASGTAQEEVQLPRRSQRTRAQREQQVAEPRPRSGPRTRGGGTPQATRRQRAAGRAADRAEDREAQRAVAFVDTAVRVQEGTRLVDYRRYRAPKLRALRWNIIPEEWHPGQRDPRVDQRFWTLTQASLYESYRQRGNRLFPHRLIDWESLRRAAGGQDIRRHFAEFEGLAELVETGPDRGRYVEDWVRVFYSTVYLSEGRRTIQFMFDGRPHRLTRQRVAEILGVRLSDRSLHAEVYSDADPPRRALLGGVAPTHQQVQVLFRQPFPVDYPRVPDLLTPEAFTVLMVLRRTILPRTGYPEGITGLQQLLLISVLTRQDFDIVDLLLAEIEDIIVDGMGSKRQFAFGHWITQICLAVAPLHSPAREFISRESEVPRFEVYRPAAPQDARRGRRADRAAVAGLAPEQRAEVEAQDVELDRAEAELQAGGVTAQIWSESDTDSFSSSSEVARVRW